jgi:hypothetical protein
VKTAPFYTSSIAYPPVNRTVYHTDTDCSLGRLIQPEHRVAGTGGLPRCHECEQAEQPGSASRTG